MDNRQDPPGDHTLVWESAGTDSPHEQRASSVHRVTPEASYAVYSLYHSQARGGDEWDLELIQIKRVATGDEETEGGVDLGEHPDEDTAKAYAQHWERHGPDNDSDHELVWVSGEDPGSQQAESTLIAPDAASARYELRPTLPGLDRSQWSLTLCQVLNNGATRLISLGAHASDVIAKVYARKWEQHGTPDGRPSVEER